MTAPDDGSVRLSAQDVAKLVDVATERPITETAAAAAFYELADLVLRMVGER